MHVSESEGGATGGQGDGTETVESLTAKLDAAMKDAEKWQALSRKNEDKAKSNADAAKELERIRTANLTDEQRIAAEREALQRQASEAAERATTAELDLLRFRVADGKIPAEDVALFLTGTDEETIRKQAERYLSLNSGQTPGPRPDHSQGGSAATGEGAGTHALNGDPLLDTLKAKLGIN